jgi:hypothetical protein
MPFIALALLILSLYLTNRTRTMLLFIPVKETPPFIPVKEIPHPYYVLETRTMPIALDAIPSVLRNLL